MGEHLSFSEGLTAQEAHRPILNTYLGQAHIAGTGPAGKTCRECRFWHKWKWRKRSDGTFEQVASAPGYYGPAHTTSPNGLKKAKCCRPIANKANRLFPHHASACRLFEQAEAPLPVLKPEGAEE